MCEIASFTLSDASEKNSASCGQFSPIYGIYSSISLKNLVLELIIIAATARTRIVINNLFINFISYHLK